MSGHFFPAKIKSSLLLNAMGHRKIQESFDNRLAGYRVIDVCEGMSGNVTMWKEVVPDKKANIGDCR